MTVPPISHSSSLRLQARPSPYHHHRRSSTAPGISHALEPDSRDMAEHPPPAAERGSAPPRRRASQPDPSHLSPSTLYDVASASGESVASTAGFSPASPPSLSRSGSFSDLDDESPVERLTVFDLLENLALPQRLEKLQHSITRRANRSHERIRSSSQAARAKVVEEWRRRVPTADEQLDRYRKRMRASVDRLTKLWKDERSITLWEKASFIAGVLNIFITGYLVGAHPEWFHYWYTLQLAYFMPIRVYTYKRKGYHYFLADLCYFVNLLTLLSIYVFPRSKRLLISTFCLAFGNNAIAIAMWRNSLVFHSMDKIVSLFIHIMPCLTLHCLVHLLPASYQKARYPAIYNVLHSAPTSPEHYTLPQMMLWASLPYAVWQLSYHLLISVRGRAKIAAGRPTSFTWLRRSFANVWIGRIVLALPEPAQEPAYMLIQYLYALLTMVPCPLWFWSRWASGAFLSAVFAWSVWNGATYYIDVFGTRFRRELEALKSDVARWQSVAQATPHSGAGTPGSPLFGGMEPLPEPPSPVVSDAKLSSSAVAHVRMVDMRLPEPAGSLDGVLRDAVPGLDGSVGTEELVEVGPESKKRV